MHSAYALFEHTFDILFDTLSPQFIAFGVLVHVVLAEQRPVNFAIWCEIDILCRYPVNMRVSICDGLQGSVFCIDGLSLYHTHDHRYRWDDGKAGYT